MKHLLSWKLNTDNDPFVWIANGLADVKYNILLDKSGPEGLIILPTGQVFIAAFETTETVPVDDFKAYLQADHDSRCIIRDIAMHVAHHDTVNQLNKEKKSDTRRIILP